MTSMTTTGRYAAVVLVAASLQLACTKKDTGATAESAAATPPNNSYVSLTGTIIEAGPDNFLLDYGEGTFLVEMDDFDDLYEGYTLKKGDEVVVYGFVDDDLYERRSLEAGSVYVRSLDTQFYASSIDEEDFPQSSPDWSRMTLPEVALTGHVASIAGDSMTLSTSQLEVQVDLSTLDQNLIDRVGHQRLSVGDQVHVIGLLSEGPLGTTEIDAESITTLMEADG